MLASHAKGGRQISSKAVGLDFGSLGNNLGGKMYWKKLGWKRACGEKT